MTFNSRPLHMQDRQIRTRLPATSFGRQATKVLYNRFQVSKHRAKEVDIPFAWANFRAFMEDLQEVAKKTDFHPDTHRLHFDLGRVDEAGRQMGYCKETMALLDSSKVDAPRTPVRRTPRAKPADEDLVQLAAEVSIALSSGPGGRVSDLADQALRNCGKEGLTPQ